MPNTDCYPTSLYQPSLQRKRGRRREEGEERAFLKDIFWRTILLLFHCQRPVLWSAYCHWNCKAETRTHTCCVVGKCPMVATLNRLGHVSIQQPVKKQSFLCLGFTDTHRHTRAHKHTLSSSRFPDSQYISLLVILDSCILLLFCTLCSSKWKK